MTLVTILNSLQLGESTFGRLLLYSLMQFLRSYHARGGWRYRLVSKLPTRMNWSTRRFPLSLSCQPLNCKEEKVKNNCNIFNGQNKKYAILLWSYMLPKVFQNFEFFFSQTWVILLSVVICFKQSKICESTLTRSGIKLRFVPTQGPKIK